MSATGAAAALRQGASQGADTPRPADHNVHNLKGPHTMATQNVQSRENRINLDGATPFNEGPLFFNVGDSCYCTSINEFVTIVEGHWVYPVRYGKERVGRWGYRIAADDGKTYFCVAGDLLDADYRPRHIKLVRQQSGRRKASMKG